MRHLIKNMTFKVTTAPSIIVQYSDLVNGADVTKKIEEAYGPKGNTELN